MDKLYGPFLGEGFHLAGMLSQERILFIDTGFVKENPFAHLQATSQYVGIKGFRDEVVGPRFKTLYDCRFLILAGQLCHIDETQVGPDPDLLADFRPVQPGHDPVDDGQTETAILTEGIPGFGAVLARDHIVAPAFQTRRQLHQSYRVIVCDKHFDGEPLEKIRAGSPFSAPATLPSTSEMTVKCNTSATRDECGRRSGITRSQARIWNAADLRPILICLVTVLFGGSAEALLYFLDHWLAQ